MFDRLKAALERVFRGPPVRPVRKPATPAADPIRTKVMTKLYGNKDTWTVRDWLEKCGGAVTYVTDGITVRFVVDDKADYNRILSGYIRAILHMETTGLDRVPIIVPISHKENVYELECHSLRIMAEFAAALVRTGRTDGKV